jgi:hypothetical protein
MAMTPQEFFKWVAIGSVSLVVLIIVVALIVGPRGGSDQ